MYIYLGRIGYISCQDKKYVLVQIDSCSENIGSSLMTIIEKLFKNERVETIRRVKLQSDRTRTVEKRYFNGT